MHICDLNFYFITRKLTTFFFSTNGQHKKKNQLQSKTKQNKTFGEQVDVYINGYNYVFTSKIKPT